MFFSEKIKGCIETHTFVCVNNTRCYNAGDRLTGIIVGQGGNGSERDAIGVLFSVTALPIERLLNSCRIVIKNKIVFVTEYPLVIFNE